MKLEVVTLLEEKMESGKTKINESKKELKKKA